jgi:hypothetical protein
VLRDDGLEVLLRRVELLGEPQELAAIARRLARRSARNRRARRDRLEHHEEVALFRQATAERNDLEVESVIVPVLAHDDVIPAHRRVLAPCPLDRERELRRETIACHLEDVHLRVSGRLLEVRPGATAKLHDIEVVVDENTGRCVARE